jgi:hypothetical protein
VVLKKNVSRIIILLPYSTNVLKIPLVHGTYLSESRCALYYCHIVVSMPVGLLKPLP